MSKTIRTMLWMILFAGTSLGIFSGCTSSKDILYFQDIDTFDARKIEAEYEPVIMKDDKLQIIISGPDKSVVMPYNFTLSTNQSGGYTTTQSVVPYLVDSQGYIDMPGLGRIKVEGMRRVDLVDHITRLLTDQGLVKEPVVSVSFLNYRITVLGEVKAPGTYTVPSERVTVLQALGMAGDLLITADRHDLILIRDVDGVQTHYKIDLTQSDILNSPYFYLHQNDVLYVPQSATRIAQGTAATGLWSIVLSSLTTLVTVATFFITRFAKPA
jgi:polysaccharide export outer membrane protein